MNNSERLTGECVRKKTYLSETNVEATSLYVWNIYKKKKKTTDFRLRPRTKRRI